MHNVSIHSGLSPARHGFSGVLYQTLTGPPVFHFPHGPPTHESLIITKINVLRQLHYDIQKYIDYDLYPLYTEQFPFCTILCFSTTSIQGIK